MMLLAERGYRCIAHDGRGHGRSTQTWNGNNMDTYADDLATQIEQLDLKNVILEGFSTGGGGSGSLHRPSRQQPRGETCPGGSHSAPDAEDSGDDRSGRRIRELRACNGA